MTLDSFICSGICSGLIFNLALNFSLWPSTRAGERNRVINLIMSGAVDCVRNSSRHSAASNFLWEIIGHASTAEFTVQALSGDFVT